MRANVWCWRSNAAAPASCTAAAAWRCTTCRVSFTAGEPQAMTQAEHDKLAEKGLLGEARLSCQMLCDPDMTLTPLQTTESPGLDAGKAPADQIEPEPVWMLD